MKAVKTLKEHAETVFAARPYVTTKVYPHQIAFNLLPHIGRV
jgi:aspartate-semialdehyde dehydrogenase